MLPVKLSIGFSALKSMCCTDHCRRNDEVCPICSEDAYVVGKRVPMLTKEESSLKCRVNGSIMDN